MFPAASASGLNEVATWIRNGKTYTTASAMSMVYTAIAPNRRTRWIGVDEAVMPHLRIGGRAGRCGRRVHAAPSVGRPPERR